MTEPSYLSAIRASYDTVAVDYAELVKVLFAKEPLGRAMLAAFAELVQANGGGPVADLGCGPGQVTAHLDALGVSAFGVDLSPKMVGIARRTYPHLRFDVGSMTALDLTDGELGGILAWWSILHTPPEVLPVVFTEFHRTLAPGGHLLVGFHVGDEHLRPERSYGHPVSYDSYLLPPDRIIESLSVNLAYLLRGAQTAPRGVAPHARSTTSTRTRGRLAMHPPRSPLATEEVHRQALSY